jgi:hypothetical protein
MSNEKSAPLMGIALAVSAPLISFFLWEAIRSENDRPILSVCLTNFVCEKTASQNGASRPSLIGRVLTWYSQISLLNFIRSVSRLDQRFECILVRGLISSSSNLVKLRTNKLVVRGGLLLPLPPTAISLNAKANQTVAQCRVCRCCCEKPPISVRVLRCSCLPSMLLHTAPHTYFH